MKPLCTCIWVYRESMLIAKEETENAHQVINHFVYATTFWFSVETVSRNQHRVVSLDAFNWNNMTQCVTWALTTIFHNQLVIVAIKTFWAQEYGARLRSLLSYLIQSWFLLCIASLEIRIKTKASSTGNKSHNNKESYDLYISLTTNMASQISPNINY